jgi:putative ABC transport system permease protein
MRKKISPPPRLIRWLLYSLDFYDEEFAFIGDCSEEFKNIARQKGRTQALIWIWGQFFCAIPSFFKLYFQYGGAMFRNYIRIAYRYFIRHKLFSFINVFGLAIGLSICMIINLWVQRELSYDRFHEKSGRIYRIERELFRENLYSRWPITGGSYKQALLDDIPEIEDAVRFWRREFSIKDYQGTVHTQELFAADNSVFEIFDFDLEEGDEPTALTEPMTVVLTRKNAVKYFGTADVIGKPLPFEWEGEPVDFRVTGILKEIPKNSHIQFNALISIASYPTERFAAWRPNYLYTYVLVRENASKKNLEEKLKAFVSSRLEPHYGDLFSQDLSIHEVLKMYLFPITNIHLHPSVNWELEPGGSISSVYIFSSIAVLILFIACINFMNLSTARASTRAKEVSLRKTVGAGKGQLKRQFIQESVLLALASLVIAFILCSWFIPSYNGIFGENLALSLFFKSKNLLLLIATTFAVGILAGLYPAFYLTKFEPAEVLKGGPQPGSRKSLFRRNMVVIQFVISTTLMIGMFTIHRQMKYIQNRSLGFDKENVVILPARSEQVFQIYDVFRKELLSNSQIVSVTASSDIPGESYYSNGGIYHRESDIGTNVIFFSSHYDFIETYRMELLAGRSFSRDFSTDAGGVVILNEAAVQKMGWSPEEAVHQEIEWGDENEVVRVIGVVKDFNFRSLRREVEPMVLMLDPDYSLAISARILPGDVEKALGFIEEKWKATFPGERFEFGFLDNRINLLYEQEKHMQHLLLIFASLSILVACLGIIGLAAFTAEIRTKEIGIRKALGASATSITLLLSKEFIKWIMLANVVAWPLAIYAMNKWLQNFVYKASIGWFVFFAAAFTTLLIATFSFIIQALKAAYANPVDSLRYE